MDPVEANSRHSRETMHVLRPKSPAGQREELQFVAYTGPAKMDPATRKLVRQTARIHGAKRRREIGWRMRTSILRHPLRAYGDMHVSPQPTQPGSASRYSAYTASRPNIDDARASLPPELIGIGLATSSSRAENEDQAASGDTIDIIQGLAKTVHLIERFGGSRMDPFVKWPIVLNLRAKTLIDYLYHDPIGKLAPYRDAWFHTSLMDAGAFHQLLCLASTYLNHISKMGIGVDTQESLAHHHFALRLVNKQIEDATTATSDGVISAIAGFSCYYYMLGDLKAWSTHMVGLKAIIHLRGGFDQVYKNEFLAMILTSVDSSGACDLDIPPCFAFPKISIRRPPYTPSPSTCELFEHMLAIPTPTPPPTPREAALVDIFSDLDLESTSLRTEASRTKGQIYSDKCYLFRHIFPLFHRLLSLPTANDTSLYEALRLAGILYCVTIRLAFTLFTTRGATQLEKLKVMVESCAYDGIGKELRDAGLWWVEAWILVMGLIVSEQNGKGKECFETRLKSTFDNRRSRMEEFKERMNEFLWFDEIPCLILKMS